MTASRRVPDDHGRGLDGRSTDLPSGRGVPSWIADSLNFCSRCGAALVKDEPGSETTMSYTPEEGEDEGALTLEELGAEGPALVVRSGGGRSGEIGRASCRERV